jgi:putative transcriptional regulator
MTKAGQKILRGAREALAYAQGEHDGHITHVPETIDVRAIRSRLGLTQADFAGCIEGSSIPPQGRNES